MKRLASLIAITAALCATPAFAEHHEIPDEAAPTAEAAAVFVEQAEAELLEKSNKAGRAEWVYNNFITEDTAAITAEASAEFTEAIVDNAVKAARYADVDGLDRETARKLTMMRTGIVTPAPTAPGAADQVSALVTDMQGVYGKGQGTLEGKPISGSDIEEKMGTVRDPALLREMWVSWHDTVGTPMKGDYTQLVGLMNEGARELGFADAGALWRSNYDMDPDEFKALTERLWQEMKPLYEQLHCYTRGKLNEKYGDGVQPDSGPIRADLLGNMWGQAWANIYDIVAPEGAGDLGYNLTELLVENDYDAIRMVKTGENFFSSLGFEPLPETFWQRSLFVKPRDREVVCHASAWDIDNKDDLRIKMCTKVNADDFQTVHHELGHNYYQRAYNTLSPLYLNGANDGFHEAIGDMIALSVTPEYLVQIGLLPRDQVPSADKDIGLLLKQALDKVAFLPFGLLIDRWRWGVFDGSIPPEEYTRAWVDMKRDYQGVVPPVERTSENFDPGAKYHIPANVPYTRYFLSFVLQFQFFEAACKTAGWKGPLHRCSFYGNKKVGEKLNAMLAMGASKPWPDALEAFTGTREISGKSLNRYFAPLAGWLKQQNKGKTCGW
ncbi:MAG: M2 family metallopeptidase [Novosphingobium sp.]|nr:M2 family metallopeptidase [Novosphingobium sp.]MCP5403052.1 M2 family metallopeptidase [Novosphingobium sp.]